MDAARFDTLTRAIGAGTTRRALTALLAPLLGVLALTGAAPEAEARKKKRRRRRKNARIEGPCGDGGGKANRCKKNRHCCTGYCKKRKSRRKKNGKRRKVRGRCRCRKDGQRCTDDRNCCVERTGRSCIEGTCRPPCAGSCPDGCCDGETCLPGDTDAACGTDGEICQVCDDGNVCTTDTCVGGECVSTPVSGEPAPGCATICCQDADGAPACCAAGVTVCQPNGRCGCATNQDCGSGETCIPDTGVCWRTCAGPPTCSAGGGGCPSPYACKETISGDSVCSGNSSLSGTCSSDAECTERLNEPAVCVVEPDCVPGASYCSLR